MLKATDAMNSGMELVDLFVNKNYLINLAECQPLPLEDDPRLPNAISLFEISKIVYDRDENINDKLVSVYSALSNLGSTALLVLVSDATGIKLYLGTQDASNPVVARRILQKSLYGNFPGIEIKEQPLAKVQELFAGQIPDVYSRKAVASVSIVPSLRDEDKTQYVQGLEKFIDSMAGETYTAVFISSPLSKTSLEEKKRGYEELYSALSQYSEVNLTYSENDSEAIAKGISDSFSTAINEGISETTGTNTSTGTSTSRFRSRTSHFDPFWLGAPTKGKSKTNTTTEGYSTGHTDTRSETETTTKSTSDTTTTTIGTSSTIAVKKQNKTVQSLLQRIDEQLARIKNCESYGLWESACYFISDNAETSMVAANTLKAIVAGEKTSVENSFVNLWDETYANSSKSLAVMNYLRNGLHPRFLYTPPTRQDAYTQQIITPASLISGLELPVLMGFPRKSVSGVTSITSTEFGRNVFVKSGGVSKRTLDIGSIYHMGEVFAQNRVKLDLESLSAHCFITGSTGSGKSNTTYKLIDELLESRDEVRFLVIEPAKGEYKQAFGGLPGINVFTTNPKYYDMLSINPFSFHEEVHVLEHLDRLIEIFSACWPLYAAMPALLKASFEQAYISCGWDLNHSIHVDCGNGKYPTFRDVLRILPEILEKSEFSAQTKGDYIGSLVTRVESLTNGLVGQIFSGNAIDDSVLFDQNTIIDLSRIGSAETKALLMGILVLKLSEYRQSTATGVNCPLKHITILEEAHNLLKRTSTEQGQESANVQRKSVEMISNSIAEMRTYGEGFVIVDQSPTAVDISAIKNTNTKIIMRLPEAADCEAIGASIALSDDQIHELSKLDRGVAVIYQNNWLEPVLAKVDRCSGKYEAVAIRTNDRTKQLRLVGNLLMELLDQYKNNEFKITWFFDIFNASGMSESLKSKYRRMLLDYRDVWNENGHLKTELSALVYQLLHCGDMFRILESKLPPVVRDKKDIDNEYRAKCELWRSLVYKNLDHYVQIEDDQIKGEVLMHLLLHKIESEKNNLPYKLVLYGIT